MLSKCYNILIRIIIRLQGCLRAFLYVHFDRTISEEELVCINEQRKHSKTILLFTHEMSLTGAPRALFNLSLVLKKNGFYVMIASLVPGPLEKEELVPSGIPFILLNIPKIANTYCFSLNLKKYISSFDMILFNTIATLPIVEGIVDVNIKKVCWSTFFYFYRTLKRLRQLWLISGSCHLQCTFFHFVCYFKLMNNCNRFITFFYMS